MYHEFLTRKGINSDYYSGIIISEGVSELASENS